MAADQQDGAPDKAHLQLDARQEPGVVNGPLATLNPRRIPKGRSSKTIPVHVAFFGPSHLRVRILGAAELKSETHEASPSWAWSLQPTDARAVLPSSCFFGGQFLVSCISLLTAV